MKHKIIAALSALSMILITAASAGAAEADAAPSSAHIDAGIVAADYAAVGSELEPSSALPASYSSLDMGYMTPVRSQQYNTCWAYSSTAVMEALLNKSEIGAGQLSPMDMNFRYVVGGDGTGWQRNYADSGYPYVALGYLTSIGAMKDEDVPDNISEETFRQIKDSVTPYAYAESIIYLDGSDRDTVKTAVMQYGAAVGNFHYNSTMINNQTSSYYCDIETIATANLFGHAIAIVGWDDEYGPENFVSDHRPDSKGAWLCKNSWGSGWASSGGYFWISYEDKHLFDSRFGPSYSISGVVLASDELIIKQNEIYGATYEFNYLEEHNAELDTVTYANVMNFSDGYNVIDKVTFESTSDGSDYDLFFIQTDQDGVPVSDEDQWVLLYTGTIGYEGYICTDIEDYTVSADTGAIGVRIRRTEQTGSLSIGADEWLSTSSKSIFLPNSTRGQSYLLGYRSEAYDVMDFYHDQLEDDIGGTFVIKAQTRLSQRDSMLGDADGDGKVDIFDASSIQKSIAGAAGYVRYDTLDPSDLAFRIADVDKNGIVDIFDASLIQKWMAGDTAAAVYGIGERI